MMHISEDILRAYFAGALSVQEELEIMEHIAVCDSCAKRFADGITQEITVAAPPDLKSGILEQTVYRKSPVRTIQELQERKRAKQKELMGYAVKVGVAMAASILMVISMSSNSVTGQKLAGEEIRQNPVSEERQQERGVPEKRNWISDSLQRVSGKAGDALSGFWDIFGNKEEKGE